MRRCYISSIRPAGCPFKLCMNRHSHHDRTPIMNTLGVTGVLQRQKLEFSFSLKENQGHHVCIWIKRHMDSRHPRPFALGDRSTLASSPPTTRSVARHALAWPSRYKKGQFYCTRPGGSRNVPRNQLRWIAAGPRHARSVPFPSRTSGGPCARLA